MNPASSITEPNPRPSSGIALNSLYNLVSIGSRRGFFSIVLLCFAAVLNVQEYALITVAISLSGVFAILVNWGFAPTITHYVSGAVVRGGSPRNLAKQLIKSQTVLALVTLLIFGLFAPVAEPLLHVGWRIYLLACLLGFLVSGTETLNAVLSGLERFQELAGISFWWFLGTVLVALASLGVGSGFRSAFFSLGFLVLAFVVFSLCIGLCCLRSLSEKREVLALDEVPWQKIKQYCSNSGLFNLVGSMLYYRTEVLFLRHWGSSRNVADYALGQTLASILFIALLRGGVGTLLPRFSKIHATGKKSQLDALYTTIQQLLLYLVFPAAMLCIVIAPIAIPLAFGREYRQSILVFQLLVPIFVLTTLSSVGQAYLFAVAGHRKLIPLLTACLFLNVVLDLILIRPLGVWGAVLGSGIPAIIAGSGSLVLTGCGWSLLPRMSIIFRLISWLGVYAAGASYIARNLSLWYTALFSVLAISAYMMLMMPELRNTWRSLRLLEAVDRVAGNRREMAIAD